MSDIQLAYLKCEKGIKMKKETETFFRYNKYDMVMHPNCTISIRCKETGDIQHTSLFNVVHWQTFEDIPEYDRPLSRQGASHAAKKGSRQLEA